MKKLAFFTLKYLFSKISRKILFYFLILVAFVLFSPKIINLLEKNPNFYNFIFWLSSLTFVFILGILFGKLIQKNKQGIREADRQKNLIKEKLYVFKNKNSTKQEKEEAFYFIIQNEFLTKDILIVVLRNLDDLNSELKDEALEILFSIKEKARDA